MSLHRRLEKRLAAFTGYEAALLFGSGYLANLGAVAALAGRGQVVFSDELNHASIIDGCRLSRAESFVYRHCDIEHLAWGLRKAAGRGGADRHRRRLLDGRRRGPARRRSHELARRHGCRLLVDEAHATGALGPGGRGAVAAAGLEGEVDVVVGTLGKALGSYGAYVCASARDRRAPGQRRAALHLLDRPAAARGRRRASPPWQCSTASRAGRARCGETPRRCARPSSAGAATPGRRAPRSSRWSSATLSPRWRSASARSRGGVFAQAIRPPTVPAGTSRLRLSVMANHRPTTSARRLR